MNIVIIGLPGSGKSKKLKQLSNRYKTVDLDDYIDFTRPNFRQQETALLKYWLKRPVIIGCGGGILLSQENRALIRNQFKIIIDDNINRCLQNIKNNPNKRLFKSKKDLILRKNIIKRYIKR